MNIKTLKRILQSGAGIQIDAKSHSINTLNELAAIACEHKAQLTIINTNSLLSDSVERLAGVGGHTLYFQC